jgi:hypothetical protein
MTRKHFILALLLGVFAASANAVNIRTDPTPGATHCGLYKNAVFDADYPVADVGGGTGCLFTIDVQAPGTTTIYTATAIVNDARWGRTESVQSLPLSVARPVAPTRPVWASNPVRALTITPSAAPTR